MRRWRPSSPGPTSSSTAPRRPAGENHFTDDEGNPHEVNIDKARTAWIATGTSDTTYEPDGLVRRQQMGSFLARLLDAFTAEDHATPPSQQPAPEPSPSPTS